MAETRVNWRLSIRVLMNISMFRPVASVIAEPEGLTRSSAGQNVAVAVIGVDL